MRDFAVRLVCLSLLAALGCSERAIYFEAKSDVGGVPEAAAPPANQPPRQDAPPPLEKGNVERKIIYTASLRLIVEDFEKGSKELTGLVKKNEGMVTASETRGAPGQPRTGTWTVRVPVQNFASFREAVLALGEPETDSLSSQDVTEEYYDVKARIGNAQKEEERLLQHLEKSTKELKDILEVERELARVRGEIERMQGRQRLLENLTALTTVTVTLIERRNYVPPQSPAFTTSVGRTFDNSVQALVTFGEGLVLAAVALAPWLAVLAVLGVPLWLVGRRRRRLPTVLPIPEPAGPADAPPASPG